MENSGFFNSELVGGVDDRAYDASHFAEYFSTFISDGIFGSISTNLQVVNTTNSGMKVNVSAGIGFIKGYWYKNTTDLQLDIDPADVTLPRIDTVVMRRTVANRDIKCYIKKGIAASSPVAAALTRDETLYELQLAELLVPAGSLNVLQANIHDTRYITALCGIVTGVVSQIDATTLFQQFDAAFQAWFNVMKDQLTEDAAGNLQTQIGFLSNLQTAFKTNLVGAINEIQTLASNSLFLGEQGDISPTIPSDADMLGGQFPSYYAKDEVLKSDGVSLLDTTFTANGVYTLAQSIHDFTHLYIEASNNGSSKSSRYIPTDQLQSYSGLVEEQGLSWINQLYVRFKFLSDTSVRVNDLLLYNKLKITGYILK